VTSHDARLLAKPFSMAALANKIHEAIETVR
jgi:hypothetical protein